MNYEEVLAEYVRLRPRRLELNAKLTRQLSKKVILKGGRKLGLFVDGTLCFETEDETSVLMDYCIHECRDLGRNTVERYLTRPGIDEEDRGLLQAMKMARFSLFRITETVRGVGVKALDLFRQESVFIVDINFGSTARNGLVLASRVMPFVDHLTTTGAALPVDEELFDTIRTAVEAWGGTGAFGRVVGFSPDQQSELTAIVLRTCLARGASHRVRYEL